MSSTSDELAKTLREITIINCGQESRSSIDHIIRELPSRRVTGLKLENFNHYKLRFLEMRSAGGNYIHKIFQPLTENPYIKLLILGNEFTTYTSYDYYCSPLKFTKMASLTELILDNENWLPAFFRDLQIYLTDGQCTLTTLELTRGLSADEVTQLKTSFRGAHSLVTYRGPDQKELQALLDEKNLEKELVPNILNNQIVMPEVFPYMST